MLYIVNIVIMYLSGWTPLHLACNFTKAEMLEYFLSIPDQFSKSDKICALELLAGSYVTKFNNGLESCYQHFVKVW